MLSCEPAPEAAPTQVEIFAASRARSVNLAQGLVPTQGVVGLANACLYIEHTPLHVTPQAITTHTFCYQQEVRDDKGI